MGILLVIVHVIVCVFLVIVVLLQSGKAADLAGAFGGMGSQTAFGPRGAATVLSKATTIAAGLFMLTSLSLSVIATRDAGTASSVLEREGKKPAATQQKGAAPAAPGQAAPTQPPPGGQPMVEYTTPGGEKRTVPLDLEKMPKVDPNAQPATPAPKK
jgi:preprotein translocase subunit SecG